MAATAQSLFDEAECFSCLGPVGTAQTLRIGLLLTILTELGVTMTPQELMTEATCYVCLPGVSQGDAVELALLNEISDGIGGGGGSSGNLSGSGDPTGVITPTAVNQIYFDTSTVPTTAYRSTGLTSADWEQFI